MPGPRKLNRNERPSGGSKAFQVWLIRQQGVLSCK